MKFDSLSRNSVFARSRSRRGQTSVPDQQRRGFWRNLIDWLTEF